MFYNKDCCLNIKINRKDYFVIFGKCRLYFFCGLFKIVVVESKSFGVKNFKYVRILLLLVM